MAGRRKSKSEPRALLAPKKAVSSGSGSSGGEWIVRNGIMSRNLVRGLQFTYCILTKFIS